MEIKKKVLPGTFELRKHFNKHGEGKKKKPPDSFHFQSFALHLTLHLKISEESSKETGV